MTTAPPSRENYSILLLTLITPSTLSYLRFVTYASSQIRKNSTKKKISSPRSKSILNPRIFPLPRCDPKRGVFARPRQCSILISDKSTNPYQLYSSNPTHPSLSKRHSAEPQRSDRCIKISFSSETVAAAFVLFLAFPSRREGSRSNESSRIGSSNRRRISQRKLFDIPLSFSLSIRLPFNYCILLYLSRDSDFHLENISDA